MNRNISTVVDSTSGSTFGYIVHDDDSFDVVGASPLASRWAHYAQVKSKSLNDTVSSLSAHLVIEEAEELTSKKVMELAEVLSADAFANLVEVAGEHILLEDFSLKEAPGRRVASNRARRRGNENVSSIYDRPLNSFSVEDRQSVVQYKAFSALTEQKKATLELEVKRVRAVFDRNIGPGGGWRCPDGTMFGGQITDRFGRGCGGSLTRRIGRAIMRAGSGVAQAGQAGSQRRLQRAARRGQRQAARRAARQARLKRRGLDTVAEQRRRAREMMARLLIGDYLLNNNRRPAGTRRPIPSRTPSTVPTGPSSRFPGPSGPAPSFPPGAATPGGRPSIPVPGGQPGGRPRVPGGQPGGRPRVPGGQGGGRPRRPRTPPDNPRDGQRWTDDDGRVWIWSQGDGFPPKGRGWVPEDGKYFPDREESNEPPESPLNGDEWTDADGRTFVWTVDTSGKNPPQWVEQNPSTSRPRIDVPEVPTVGPTSRVIDVPEVPELGPTSPVRPGQNNTGRTRRVFDRPVDPKRALQYDDIKNLTPEQLDELRRQLDDGVTEDLPEVDPRDLTNARNRFPRNGLPERAWWRDRDDEEAAQLERRFGRYYYDEEGNLNERGKNVNAVLEQERIQDNINLVDDLIRERGGTPPSRRRDRRRKRDTEPNVYIDPETGDKIDTETGEIIDRGPGRERVGETPAPQRKLRERVSAAIERAAQRLLDNETPASRRRRRRGDEPGRRQRLIDAIERAAQRLLQENDQSRFGRREDNRRRRRRGETDAADEDLRRRLEGDIREELGLDRERDPDPSPEDLERDKQIEEEAGRIIDAMDETGDDAEDAEDVAADFDRWNDMVEGVIKSIDESDLSDAEKNRLKNRAREAMEDMGTSWGNRDRLQNLRSREQRERARRSAGLSDEGRAFSERIDRLFDGALESRERAMGIREARRERERVEPPKPDRPPTPGFSREVSDRNPMRDLPDLEELDDADIDQLIDDLATADLRAMDRDMAWQVLTRRAELSRERTRRSTARKVPEASPQQRRYVRDRLRGMVPSRPYWRDEGFTGDRDRLERQLGDLYDGFDANARLNEAGRNLRNDMETEKLLFAERIRESRSRRDPEPAIKPVGPDRSRSDGLGGETVIPAGEINPDAELGSEENFDELGQWYASLPDDPEFDPIRRDARRFDEQIKKIYDDPKALRERRLAVQKMIDDYNQMVDEAGDDVDERTMMNRYVSTAQAALERINRRLLQLDNSNSRNDDDPNFDPEQLRLFEKIDDLIDGDANDRDILDPIVKRTKRDEDDDGWVWDDPVKLSTGSDVPTELSPDWEERASQMPEDQQEKFRYLARFAQYGPTYNRGVAESLMTAHRFRDSDNAYYMAQAEQSAHNAITGGKSKAPDLDKPSEYTSLPWNKPKAKVGDDDQSEMLMDQWALKTVSDMHRIAQDGDDVGPIMRSLRKLNRWGADGDEDRQSAVNSQLNNIISNSPLDDDVARRLLDLDDEDFEKAVALLNEVSNDRVKDLRDADPTGPAANNALRSDSARELAGLLGIEGDLPDFDDAFLDDVSRRASGMSVAQRADLQERRTLARVFLNSSKRQREPSTPKVDSSSPSDLYPDMIITGISTTLEEFADYEDFVDAVIRNPNTPDEVKDALRAEKTRLEEDVIRDFNDLMRKYFGDDAPRVMASEDYRRLSENLYDMVRDQNNNDITNTGRYMPQSLLVPDVNRPAKDFSTEELDSNIDSLNRFLNDPALDIDEEFSTVNDGDWTRGVRAYILDRKKAQNREAAERKLAELRTERESRDNPVDRDDLTPDRIKDLGTEVDDAVGVEELDDSTRSTLSQKMADAWARRRSRLSRIIGYDQNSPRWENEEPKLTADDLRSFTDIDPDDARLVDGKPSPAVQRQAREFAEQAFNFEYDAGDGVIVRSSVLRADVDSSGVLSVTGMLEYRNPETGEMMRLGRFERKFLSDGTMQARGLGIDNVELSTGKGLDRVTVRGAEGFPDSEIDVHASSAVEKRALPEGGRKALNDLIQSVEESPGKAGVWEIFSDDMDKPQKWYIGPRSKEPDAKIFAYRLVDDEALTSRNSGLGTAFNFHSYNWASKAGFTRTELDAGGDGSYVWGRAGFRPRTQERNSLLWAGMDSEIVKYRAGKDSIIESDAQAEILEDLSRQAREADFDPETSPSYMEAIMALEIGSDRADRSQQLKGFFQDSDFEFVGGTFSFDDRIQPRPSDTVAGDPADTQPRTVGSKTVKSVSNIPVPRRNKGSVIDGNDTSTRQGAVDHVRGGGSIEDVADDVFPEVLEDLSATDLTGEPGSAQYLKGEDGVYRNISSSGVPTQQGWQVIDDSFSGRVDTGEKRDPASEVTLTPNALEELRPGLETWSAEAEGLDDSLPATEIDGWSMAPIDPGKGAATVVPKGTRGRVFKPTKRDLEGRRLMWQPLEGGDGKHYWTNSYVFVDTRKMPDVQVGYAEPPYGGEGPNLTSIIAAAPDAKDEIRPVGTAVKGKESYVILQHSDGEVVAVDARYYDGIVRNNKSLRFFINRERTASPIFLRNEDDEVVGGIMPVNLASRAEEGLSGSVGQWTQGAASGSAAKDETSVAGRVSQRILDATASGTGDRRRFKAALNDEEEIEFMISELKDREDILEDMIRETDPREAIQLRSTQRSLRNQREQLDKHLKGVRESGVRAVGTPTDMLLVNQTAAMLGLTNQGGFQTGDGRVVVPLAGNSFSPDLSRPADGVTRFEDLVDRDEERGVGPRLLSLTHRWMTGMTVPDHIKMSAVWDEENQRIVAVIPSGEVGFENANSLSLRPLIVNGDGDVTLRADLSSVVDGMTPERREEFKNEVVAQVREMFRRGREASGANRELWKQMFIAGMPEDADPPMGFDSMDAYVDHLMSVRETVSDRSGMEDAVINEIIGFIDNTTRGDFM